MLTFRWVIAAVVCCGVADTCWAQRPRFQPRPNSNQGQANNNDAGDAGSVLPEDPRLRELHKTFVENAEKLAAEYERTHQIDKARAVYQEILRLVPIYTPAKEKLGAIHEREATAERKVLDIFANKEWQDTGITLVEGKPVRIKAEGSWNFRLQYTLDPDGVSIPKELRDFNLGSLIGIVATGDPKEARPFFVGANKEFVASQAGRLFLRMYDGDPSDNVGKVSVTIEGTFEK